MSDPKAALEKVLAKSSAGKYELRLYVTGHTPRSSHAIANIRRICDQFLKDRHELTVIDLFEHPEKARQEQVIAAPTLVKTRPLPLRRLIGDLSDESRVLLALDI
jgi:circadian clock protein KaiB